MNRSRLAAMAMLLLTGAASAADKTFELTIAAGKADRINDPVCVIVALPADIAAKDGIPTMQDAAGKPVPCQLTGLSLLAPQATSKEALRELHFILPNLKAGDTATFKATVSTSQKAPSGGFAWKDGTPYTDLTFDGRPVLRYVHYSFDDSTAELRSRTFKVFHHLYDPTGKHLVTNDGVVGLYPHHRGIFFGFNKITYGDGKKADVWHGIKKGNEDAHQTHEKNLASEAGPVLGRHRVEIAWHGEKKEVFAIEERELTVYNVPGGELVEFATRVRTTNGPVKLDGDPQHAGFHFRADKEVADKAKSAQTIFVRPDGPGEPGKTRNWPADKAHVNLPWNAMSFVLGTQRYTLAYLDKPTNPKEARESEREYGRIGSYFVYEVTEKKPLTLNYRLWLQEGQMKPEQVAERSMEFVLPVVVTVK
jgi:hypothetical protein